jgi:hypothetical protein
MNKASAAFVLFCMFFFSTVNAQNEREWKVWIKTSPCSGRFDWISVAKQNPSGGGNFFVLANQIFPTSSCTNYGCTYSEALSVANALRTNDKFLSYCCHNYSVWKNIQTGNFTVVFGDTSPGSGWQEVKGNLCCDEAETVAGLPGFCSGNPVNNNTNGLQGNGYKVWIKTSPCSGRYDWVTVAKDNPANGGGGGAWLIANLLVNPDKMQCLAINSSCTLAAAQAEAAIVRTSPIFANYCCKDYNVWKNIQTDKFTIVLGSNPPGNGWRFIGGPYCCEDAEAVAGIPGACSGTVHKDDCYPGSHAVYDEKHNTKQCYCNEGLVWNDTKTACITIQELEKEAVCNYPGSYAHWNPATKKVECWCPEGKKWNAARTACIDINDNEPKTNTGNGSSQEYASIFKRMIGTWRTDYAEITITGTYDNASGTIRKKQFCHPLSETTAIDELGTLSRGKMGKNAFGQTALLIHYDFNDGNDMNLILVLNDDDTLYFKYFPCNFGDKKIKRVN